MSVGWQPCMPTPVKSERRRDVEHDLQTGEMNRFPDGAGQNAFNHACEMAALCHGALAARPDEVGH